MQKRTHIPRWGKHETAELRMPVVLEFVVAERVCVHHWRLGTRVVGVLVKGQPV